MLHAPSFALPQVNRVDTGGNKYKLLNKSFYYGIRWYSCTARAINTCNSLPNNIVDAESINIFKTRLDKYWSHQPLQYEITRVAL